MTTSYPSLTSPYPAALNSHGETVEHGTMEWLERYEIVCDQAEAERVRGQQWSYFVARCYPHASLPDLQWVSNWTTWLFLFDDQNDEAEQGRATEDLTPYRVILLSIMGGDAPIKNDPLLQAWHGLLVRLRAKANPVWLERFVQQHDDYFSACIWKASNRSQGRIPDLEPYLLKRLHAGAVYPCLSLIEFVGQLDLPPSVLSHPIVHELTLSTNNLVCWCNDIVSREKEQRHGDVHNLVIVLRHEQQCSLQEAIDRAVIMHDAEMQRFQSLLTQLPSFSRKIDADLQLYVKGLQFWIRGNLDWSFETERYRPLLTNNNEQIDSGLA